MRLLLSRVSSAACLNLILTQEARIIDAAWYCHIALASAYFPHIENMISDEFSM